MITAAQKAMQRVLERCGVPCASPSSAKNLNRCCFCLAVDPAEVRANLNRLLDAHGGAGQLNESHANLFSALPVFVPESMIKRMAEAVRALTAVATTEPYQRVALGRAPDIARYDPGSPGGVLGFDFHLTATGPKLIEINTNPGGLLLNAMLAQAQQPCVPELGVAFDGAAAERRTSEILIEEWSAQIAVDGDAIVAIVDEAPEEQFLHAEFVLFQRLLEAQGYRAVICDPATLHYAEGALWFGTQRVGFVYNRLTDFSLAGAQLAPLREAYVAGAVALSPHPRAHAIWADKRNLCQLSDRDFLANSGLSRVEQDVLAEAVPLTVTVTADNRDALWRERRGWFFKPAAGFGSRASYRGDKLTHKAWAAIAEQAFVAQALVPPSERHTGMDGRPLKVDVRCYAYRGEALLFAARLYQGQTTNFRTPDGGFAPVLTLLAPYQPALMPVSGWAD
ncbi:MAG: hypothetical protein ACT4NL_03785 [Pseudomarimonas sp.]|jgi:hypothetical protein|nr:hypothetical protein [Xanthomonadales bacterium]